MGLGHATDSGFNCHLLDPSSLGKVCGIQLTDRSLGTPKIGDLPNSFALLCKWIDKLSKFSPGTYISSGVQYSLAVELVWGDSLWHTNLGSIPWHFKNWSSTQYPCATALMVWQTIKILTWLLFQFRCTGFPGCGTGLRGKSVRNVCKGIQLSRMAFWKVFRHLY